MSAPKMSGHEFKPSHGELLETILGVTDGTLSYGRSRKLGAERYGLGGMRVAAAPASSASQGLL